MRFHSAPPRFCPSIVLLFLPSCFVLFWCPAVHLFFRRVPPCFILFLPSCSVCSVLGGFVSGGQFGFNSGRVLILGLIFMGFGGRPRLGGVCFGVYFRCSVYIRRRCSVVLVYRSLFVLYKDLVDNIFSVQKK
jgi:hypothetical protein